MVRAWSCLHPRAHRERRASVHDIVAKGAEFWRFGWRRRLGNGNEMGQDDQAAVDFFCFRGAGSAYNAIRDFVLIV